MGLFKTAAAAAVIFFILMVTAVTLVPVSHAEEQGWSDVLDSSDPPEPQQKKDTGENDGWDSVLDPAKKKEKPAPAPAPAPVPKAPPKPEPDPKPDPAPKPEPAPKIPPAPAPKPQPPESETPEPKDKAPEPKETKPAEKKMPGILGIINTLLTVNMPAQLPPTLYINNMTSVQYAGAVSMAHEGMRVFYGDMNEEQERLFDAKWKPLYQYPSQEIVSYLNQLNPLLVQFLATRSALNESIEEFNSSQFQAMSAANIGDARSVSSAMSSAVMYSMVTKILNARLQVVGKQILDLGDPPNAEALRKRAAKRHEEAIKTFFKMPDFSITPAKLNAVAGKEYTFTIKLNDKALMNKPKLSVYYAFDGGPGGWGKFKDGSFTIKQVFRTKIGTDHQLEVKLQQYPGPKTLGVVKSKIRMIKDPGCWTLVECKVKKESYSNLEYLVDKETRRIEASFLSPQIIDKVLDRFTYRHTWNPPPQRIFPGAVIRFPVMVERLHKYDKVDISTDEYSKLSEAQRTRHKVRRANQMKTGMTAVSWMLAKSADEFDNYAGSGRGAALEKRQKAAKGAGEPFTVPLYKYDSKLYKGRMLWMEVRAVDPFFYAEDPKGLTTVSFDREASVLYGYKWDPTGTEKALDLGEGTARVEIDSTAQDPEKQAKIEFHKHNINYFNQRIKSINEQLKQIKDPDAKNNLMRDLLYARDARQREVDAIATIQTGQFVRTRTQLDALNMEIMAQESLKLAQKWHTIKRVMERGPRLIELAPENEQDELYAFFKRHVTGENVASGESDKLRQAMEGISNRVLGSLEKQREEHLDEADFWDRQLEAAQNVKTFADYSMMLLSFTAAGPTYALFGQTGLITASGVTYQIYGAATGYIEGGWQESVSRTLAGFNAATTIVDAGMRGYQNGVLQHLEEYARNPEKVKLDESKAGFEGAAWSAGTAAAFAAAIKLGTHAYQRRQAILKQKEAWRQMEYDLVKHDFRMRYHNKRFAQADVKIKTFEQRRIALSNAGKSGASKEEIMRLRNELDDAYKDIKTDWFAKTRMKALASKADFKTSAGKGAHKTIHAYNSADRRFTKQLQKRLSQRMTDAGFNQQNYKTFSNSASKGGVGMDIDMGVVEPPRYKIVGGKQVPNPKHAEWRKGLTRNVEGTVRRTSPHEMQKVGNEQLKSAFEDVFGRKPGEAMVEFTTSYSPEAYRDPRWLGNKSSKTGLVYSTDPAWTQQAGDVTKFKVNNLGKDHPSLGYYANMQENCRGLVKDMKTKLNPLMKGSKNPEAVKHMKKVQNTMERFVNNEIGPLEAELELRMLTGNKDGVRESAERFGVLLQGLRSPTN